MKGGDAKLVVKQMISVVKSCLAKAKFMAMVRNKTDAFKATVMVTRLTVMSKKKKFRVSAISDKINDAIDGIFSKHREDDDNNVDSALVLYENSYKCNDIQLSTVDHDDDQYPDLRHSLFEEEGETKEKLEEELQDLLASGVDPRGNAESVIELVKNSKENFNLEEEIDEVADLFITKFHRRMRLQKLLSFKRNQQMLERSA